MLWTKLYPLHQKSYVKALTLNVNLFEDKTFKKVIKLNEVIRVGP